MRTFKFLPGRSIAFCAFLSYFTMSVWAQDYKPLRDSTLYTYGDYGDYMSLKVAARQDFPGYSSYTLIDQVAKHPVNHDFNYYLIPDHWLAKEVLDYHNGSMEFVTSADDTLLIVYSAQPGQTWEVTKLPNGDRLMGEVRYIRPIVLFGGSVVDSIKTITFLAYDQNQTLVYHPWTGKNMEISKFYGLYNYFYLSEFPNSSYMSPPLSFRLSGYRRDSLRLGRKKIGFRQIFDFQPGMELHFRERGSSGLPGETGALRLEAWQINQVSWTDSTEVRIKYDLFKNSHALHNNSPMEFIGSVTKTFSSDSTDYNLLNKFAGQYERTTFHGADMLKVVHDPRPSIPGHEAKQLAMPFRSLGNLYAIYEQRGNKGKVYHEGLGLTYDYSFGFPNARYRELVFFRNGTETWGTPNTFVGTNEPSNPKLSITLFPNPSSNEFYIEFEMLSREKPEVLIYSLDGKRLWKRIWDPMDPGERRFRIASELTPGLYMLELRLGTQSSRKKLLIR